MPYRHVYVHVPFCARRCAYCDFAIAVRRDTPVDQYLEALAAELSIRRVSRYSVPLDSLYLGGGTPSRLGGEGVARLLELLRTHLPVAPTAEVTLEANPEDVDAARVREWHRAGVNRVSLGVQSFEPGVLKWMHRSHDVAHVATAAEALHAGGIPEWSLDLIYALPREVERDWEQDLARALALDAPHISAYGLTVEPGTPLARWASRGALSEADEDRYERDFLVTHEALTAAGYQHYEVSNYARHGHRARHNSAYWLGVPYLGLGPAAHGFDGEVRRWNEREYAGWRRRLDSAEDPIAGEEHLTAEQQALERVYIGLRSDRGVSVEGRDMPVVGRWLAEGWGRVDDGILRLTPLGWLRLDALVAALTDHRSRY